MAGTHKLIFAGLMIFISVKWTLSVPGKDTLHIDVFFLYYYLQKLRMLTFRCIKLHFKHNQDML